MSNLVYREPPNILVGSAWTRWLIDVWIANLITAEQRGLQQIRWSDTGCGGLSAVGLLLEILKSAGYQMDPEELWVEAGRLLRQWGNERIGLSLLVDLNDYRRWRFREIGWFLIEHRRVRPLAGNWNPYINNAETRYRWCLPNRLLNAKLSISSTGRL